eukprot:CAMPEP_0194301620 /NCGR_PEP_ID=MMETSP0169-20130528/61894_1 /TAXON_ID=218684 /ORGANISM="Corethron pennatum, Strain L29A3" /LENGTH=88 /DNA_ID=CAMNT_0039051883 /DNA_START=823 /DNA_END=1084 /DNA_ORIENTATION=+
MAIPPSLYESKEAVIQRLLSEIRIENAEIAATEMEEIYVVDGSLKTLQMVSDGILQRRNEALFSGKMQIDDTSSQQRIMLLLPTWAGS